LHWLLARLASELNQREAGSEAQARQLMQMMFIELMREYLVSDQRKKGWLSALADPGIRRALQAMHAEPARAWGLQELADSALMSRSAFAARFKSVVGVPPLDYLIRWRMHLASQALRGGTVSVAEVAESVGYSSESAFGNAFKRVLGHPPKRYVTNLAI
jgi:transcriptional regulator GlxA family with amidase domain